MYVDGEMERVLRQLNPHTLRYERTFTDVHRGIERMLSDSEHRKSFEHGDFDALPHYISVRGVAALWQDWVCDGIVKLRGILGINDPDDYPPVRRDRRASVRERARDALEAIGPALARVGASRRLDAAAVEKATNAYRTLQPLVKKLAKQLREIEAAPEDTDFKTRAVAELAAKHGIAAETLARVYVRLSEPKLRPSEAAIQVIADEYNVGQRAIESALAKRRIRGPKTPATPT